MNVSDGLQLGGKSFCILKAWKKNQIMHLPRFAVLFINGADLACHNKARRSSRHSVGKAVLFFQRIHAFSC